MDDVIKISKLEGFSITNNKDGGTFKIELLCLSILEAVKKSF